MTIKYSTIFAMNCYIRGLLTPSCVDVKAIEEEVLYGGPDPERHAALAIKHCFCLNVAFKCHNHIAFDNSVCFVLVFLPRTSLRFPITDGATRPVPSAS